MHHEAKVRAMIGWLQKVLFRAKEKTVREVVSTYGELLEMYPVAICDTAMLPIPKAKMKELMKALYSKATNAAEQHHWEQGFMYLANFQEGVGSTPVDDPLQTAKTPQAIVAAEASLDRWMKWQKLALAEMDLLLDEWRAFKEGAAI
jgi:hypothetical protein